MRRAWALPSPVHGRRDDGALIGPSFSSLSEPSKLPAAVVEHPRPARCRPFSESEKHESEDTSSSLEPSKWLRDLGIGRSWGSLNCLAPAGCVGGALAGRIGRADESEEGTWSRRHGCCAAAAACDLSALKRARARGDGWDCYTCSAAAGGGHLAVLHWARAQGCPWDSATCRAAAAGGHLAVLQWARAQGCEWDGATCRAAARGGHLAVLEWAVTNGCIFEREACMRIAHRHGHADVLSWLHFAVRLVAL
jgi:hypothetical protein